MSIRIFRTQILSWYSSHKRDLPWRNTRDPYKILVSELMLQQTQVSRVMPLYAAFLKRWPTLESLATAELGEVIRAWKGLGYNRRAKFLWELARHPSNKLLYRKLTKTDLPALQELPGIGHYTAAAIAAFAHNADVAATDTNIRRIHQRYFGNASAETITRSVPPGKARDWHNALMDFGSLVCTKKPACERCPLRQTCRAYKMQDFTVSVPKQSRFANSNRFFRGRILNALRDGPRTAAQLATLGATANIERALGQLVAEGLVRKAGQQFTL